MGSGNCLFWAPESFDLGDDGRAVVLDPEATDEDRLGWWPRGARSGRSRSGGTAGGSTRELPDRAGRDHRRARGPPSNGSPVGGGALPAVGAPGGARESTAAEPSPVWKALAGQGWLGLPRGRGGRRRGLRPGGAGRGARGAGAGAVPRPAAPDGARRPPPWPAAAGPGARAAAPARTGRRHGAGRRALGDGALAAEGPTAAGSWSRARCDRCSAGPQARWCWCRWRARGWCVLDGDGDPGWPSSPWRRSTPPARSADAHRRRGARRRTTACCRSLAGEEVADLALVIGGGRGGRAAPAGAWTRLRTTPRSGCSSAGRSASSRRSSTSSPTCWWRWSRPTPWPGTPPRPGPATRSRRAGPWPPRWPARWPSRRFAACAKACVQILGGIGFTWEHDAHLYLRRAMATRQLLGEAGPPRATGWPTLALAGARRSLAADLPPEADAVRERAWRRWWPRWPALEGDAQRAAMVATRAALAALAARRGGAAPRRWSSSWSTRSWPRRAWPRPHIGVGAWALPTIIAHGTPEQQERWVRPTLLGRAVLVPAVQRARAPARTWPAWPPGPSGCRGGWRLTGQKVWTSMAQTADWGICLARTDPTRAQARGHHLLRGRHARRGARRAAAARAHRRRHVQRGLPDRRVRAGRLRDRRSRAGAGPSPGPRWPTSGSRCRPGSTFGTGVESVLRRVAALGDGRARRGGRRAGGAAGRGPGAAR